MTEIKPWAIGPFEMLYHAETRFLKRITIYGLDIASDILDVERTSYFKVALKEQLRTTLSQINPTFQLSALMWKFPSIIQPSLALHLYGKRLPILKRDCRNAVTTICKKLKEREHSNPQYRLNQGTERVH